MAALLSLPSSSSTATRLNSSKTHANSANFSSLCSFSCSNSLSFLNNSRSSSHRLISSKLFNFQVQATILQDDEEKVEVPESFPPKTSVEDIVKENSEAMSLGDSTSNGFERWIIKLEQSINIILTDSVINVLDTLYHDRDYARFFVLETIARVPYFAFISVLHLYESFGWWRRADYLKVHFAESWNEMHHLLIMEELGGNSSWFDRFLAQHIAVFYYIMTVIMYAISPRMAYHFSECVESHAFQTYDKFIKAQGDELKKLQAPDVAVKYYTGGDLYLFDEFQTSRVPCSRRPKIENLYDVFVNIREDEAEHCKTMRACQTHGNLRSPHSSTEDIDESGCIPSQDCEVPRVRMDNQIGTDGVKMGDIYGDHAVSCAGIVGVKHRHNLVRDTLYDVCIRSGISAGKEVDIRLGSETVTLRLADLLLYSWDRGRDVCLDLTGCSPLTQSGMAIFVPGCAVMDAASWKRGKYAD